MPNQEILRRAELTGIDAMLNLAQLRWSGHVTHMDDSRLQNNCSMLSSQLKTAQRWAEEAVQRCAEITLKAYNIPVDEWQALAQDRPAWRAAICKGTKPFERSRLQSPDDKRSARKNRLQTLALLFLVGSAARSALPLSGSKPICAKISTDVSSSKSKDYYYYYYYYSL